MMKLEIANVTSEFEVLELRHGRLQRKALRRRYMT